MPFCDAHCHLDWFDKPLDVIKRSLEKGVSSFFSCSTNLESMKKHLTLFSGNESIKIGLGLHPSDLLSLKENQVEEALVFLEKNIPKAHAVGEIGLDFKYAKSTAQRLLQEQVFVRQVELALQHGLPVAVHARYAEKKTMEILAGLGAKKVLMHWFTNSIESTQIASRNGFFMSVGPIIISSKEAREVAISIPENLLLLETDCPVEFLGKKSEPFWVEKVAKELSTAKETKPENIAKTTTKNYYSLFK